MQYILNGVEPHHFSYRTFVWKEGFYFSEIMCFLFCCFTRMEGHTVMSLLQMAIIYIYIQLYTRRLFQKKYSLKKILLHGFFNQLIHNCVKLHTKLFTYRFQQIFHRQQALELPKIYQGIGIKKGLRTCCIINTSACLL